MTDVARNHRHFLCPVTGGGECTANYAVVSFSLEMVRKILERHNLLTVLAKADEPLEAMEFRNADIDFFETLPATIDPELEDMFNSMELEDDGSGYKLNEYQPLPDDFVVPMEMRGMSYHRIYLTVAHCYWIGALDDIGTEFETPVIPIAWLEKLEAELDRPLAKGTEDHD